MLGNEGSLMQTSRQLMDNVVSEKHKENAKACPQPSRAELSRNSQNAHTPKLYPATISVHGVGVRACMWGGGLHATPSTSAPNFRSPSSHASQ